MTTEATPIVEYPAGKARTYTWNWRDFLVDNETIVSATVTVADPATAAGAATALPAAARACQPFSPPHELFFPRPTHDLALLTSGASLS